MTRQLNTTLCPNGAINCWSDDSSGDAHTVLIGRKGEVLQCSCKGYQYSGHCYHARTIRASGQLRAAARAALQAYK